MFTLRPPAPPTLALPCLPTAPRSPPPFLFSVLENDLSLTLRG